jgi:beta-glucosidase
MEKPGLTARPATEQTPFLEEVNTSRVKEIFQNHRKVVITTAIMILLLPLLGLIALKGRGAKAEYVSPVVYPSREYCNALRQNHSAY